MKQFFGTDGIRGIANIELTNEIVYKAVKGMVIEEKNRGIKRPKVFIGRDTRASSAMFNHTIASALISAGCDAVDLGVIPTPALSYLIKSEKYDFGINITASHNPYNQNGIKIFNSEGRKISDELEEKIEKYILGEIDIKEHIETKDLGIVELDEKQKYADKYIKYIKKNFKGLDLKKLNIFIDAANGATSKYAKKFFESFGTNIEIFSDKPDGYNINYKAGATHPEVLQKIIRKKENKGKVDIGLVFDGDGDRLIVIDDKGNILSGDIILTIIAEHLAEKKNMEKELVVTMMTNKAVINYLQNKGYKVYQTKVGDRYVFEKMHAEKIILGGEQSGHIIYTKMNSTGDSMQSALLLLEAMQERKEKLSELAKEIPKYPQVLVNAEVKKDRKKEFIHIDTINKRIERIEKELNGKGRVLIRPSGTENLIRVMIEGEDKEQITKWAEELADMYHRQLS